MLAPFRYPFESNADFSVVDLLMIFKTVVSSTFEQEENQNLTVPGPGFPQVRFYSPGGVFEKSLSSFWVIF